MTLARAVTRQCCAGGHGRQASPSRLHRPILRSEYRRSALAGLRLTFAWSVSLSSTAPGRLSVGSACGLLSGASSYLRCVAQYDDARSRPAFPGRSLILFAASYGCARSRSKQDAGRGRDRAIVRCRRSGAGDFGDYELVGGVRIPTRADCSSSCRKRRKPVWGLRGTARRRDVEVHPTANRLRLEPHRRRPLLHRERLSSGLLGAHVGRLRQAAHGVRRRRVRAPSASASRLLAVTMPASSQSRPSMSPAATLASAS